MNQLPNGTPIVVVAAADTPLDADGLTADGLLPDYICDGVDDQVEIQAAVNLAKNLGGAVTRLEAGTYDAT